MKRLLQEEKYVWIAAQLEPEDSEKIKAAVEATVLDPNKPQPTTCADAIKAGMRCNSSLASCSALRSNSSVRFYMSCSVTHVALSSSLCTMVQDTKLLP
jgi:hypothetical protein